MNNQMNTYSITTQTRTYNHIESTDPVHLMERLMDIRRIWNDWTPTVNVFVWVNGSGWQSVSLDSMIDPLN